MPFLLLGFLLLGGGCNTGVPDDASRPSKAVPPRAGSLLTHAQDALRNGAYREALALTNRAERHASDLPQLFFIRGRIYSELKHFDAAESAYKKALAHGDAPGDAWLNLGNNAMRQDHLRKAISYYRKALTEEPSPNAYLYMGRAYNELGKIDSALYMFDRAVDLDSTSAQAHAHLGQVYKQTGELKRALAASRRALELEPGNLDYRYVVGSQLLQTGHPRQALPKLKAVTQKRPWHYGALYNMGQALARLDRTDEAQQYFARADSAQQMQASIDQMKETARLNPDRLMVWVELGNALRRAGQLKEAKAAFNRALYLAPQNLALQNNVANLAHDLGRAQEAVQRYQAVLRRDPDLINVWLNLGVVYAQMGRPADASRAWKTVLERAPDNKTAKSYLAHLKDSSRTPQADYAD